MIMYYSRIRPCLTIELRHDKTYRQFFLTKSDKNRAVQSHKMANGLKFLEYEVQGVYFL